MKDDYKQNKIKELQKQCENIISQIQVIEYELRKSPKSFSKIQKMKMSVYDMNDKIKELLE